jgi:hypothetical protein
MSLLGRLSRAEAQVGMSEGECPGAITCTIITTSQAGEPVPDPPIPEDARRCPLCGEVHAMVLHKVIVSSRAEVEWVESQGWDAKDTVA